MKFTLFSTIILLFSSCVKDVEYKLDFEGSKVVVNAIGIANNNLQLTLTRTILPLSEANNPDSLLVDNAIIEVFENEKLIDTMNNYFRGKYISNCILKEGFIYSIKIKAKDFDYISSSTDIVPIPAKIINVKLNISDTSDDTTTSLDLILKANLIIKESKKFPYNSLEVRVYYQNKNIERILSLNSHSNFIECDDCFNLLDNPCVKKLNNDLVEINSDFTLYNVDFYANDIDSVKVYLATFSSLADKVCQNGIDMEVYYGNPLPFASNPSVNFTNIEGGYGIFALTNVDSASVKF